MALHYLIVGEGAPEHDLAAIEEALVEREPITVVVSDKGWVRTLKGQVAGIRPSRAGPRNW